MVCRLKIKFYCVSKYLVDWLLLASERKQMENTQFKLSQSYRKTKQERYTSRSSFVECVTNLLKIGLKGRSH
jgi:hypothetical protein